MWTKLLVSSRAHLSTIPACFLFFLTKRSAFVWRPSLRSPAFDSRCAADSRSSLGKPVRGVALWFPPDAPPPSEQDLADTGIAAAPELIGESGWRRLKTLLDHVEALHPTMVPDPHWYLTVLGVDPVWQRQGIGEALMKPVFDHADRDNVPCYLEAPTQANARYYGRRGFDIVGETTVPGSDVHIWLMRRDPRTN